MPVLTDTVFFSRFSQETILKWNGSYPKVDCLDTSAPFKDWLLIMEFFLKKSVLAFYLSMTVSCEMCACFFVSVRTSAGLDFAFDD